MARAPRLGEAGLLTWSPRGRSRVNLEFQPEGRRNIGWTSAWSVRGLPDSLFIRTQPIYVRYRTVSLRRGINNIRGIDTDGTR